MLPKSAVFVDGEGVLGRDNRKTGGVQKQEQEKRKWHRVVLVLLPRRVRANLLTAMTWHHDCRDWEHVWVLGYASPEHSGSPKLRMSSQTRR